MKIPITQPHFGEEEKQRVQEPLESGWVVQGPKVEAFEEAFSDFTGLPRAAATTSCTTAMHLAIVALDLEPGDEVIVPSFTWVSTPNVVEYMNARPVFSEVRLDTYNLDPEAVQEKITDDTVGIFPVHLFGLAADMDPLLEIAEDHDLWVAEDAACAFGATYRGEHVGALGDAGCFSFHPRKSITTGEGGMVTTDDPDIDRLVRSLRDHGATKTDRERHGSEEGFLLPDYPRVGFNYRMTDLQAAVGCVQMERAEYILATRREQAERYDEALGGEPWIRIPHVPDDRGHGYQTYVTLFAPEDPTLDNVDELHEKRNDVMRRLSKRGIATRQGTHAAALQEIYRDKYGIEPADFPVAHLLEKLTLALPMYADLTVEDQQTVITALQEAYAEV